MATVTLNAYYSGTNIAGVNMDAMHVHEMFGATIQTATSTGLALQAGTTWFSFNGTGFTYDANEQINGGILTSFEIDQRPASGDISFTVTGLSTPIAPFAAWIPIDATETAFTTLFAGADTFFGATSSPASELIRSYGGADQISGEGGNDTIFGGQGDDTIWAMNQQGFGLSGSTYLRGDEGADSIVGGKGFDDINGNMGNDTARGGDGRDWVVGGQGDDLLFGDAEADIVYGNMGADTLDGGHSGDTVRGGQDNDSISGGPGYDWLSGDRGDDTIAGGSEGDIFYIFNGSGVDRVVDFHIDEGIGPGDRVMIDPGQAYTVSQVGADTVIDLGGGDKMILVGVQMSTLTGGWILNG